MVGRRKLGHADEGRHQEYVRNPNMTWRGPELKTDEISAFR